jgi:monoamine oxidase
MPPIVIIGGGIAGLYAARRLRQRQVPLVLLEARDRLGGRVLSVDAMGAPADDGFDLGPSWFWPRTQLRLAALADELGLSSFAQYSDGDVLFEHLYGEGGERHHGGLQEALSV